MSQLNCRADCVTNPFAGEWFNVTRRVAQSHDSDRRRRIDVAGSAARFLASSACQDPRDFRYTCRFKICEINVSGERQRRNSSAETAAARLTTLFSNCTVPTYPRAQSTCVKPDLRGLDALSAG